MSIGCTGHSYPSKTKAQPTALGSGVNEKKRRGNSN